MSQVNPNVPEDGFRSKKDFLDRGQINDSDLAIVNKSDPTKKLVFDASAIATAGTTTITFPKLGGTLSAVQVATFRNQQNEGTAGGGTTSGAFVSQVPLNTFDDPDSIGVSLASNQFTLPAGRYFIQARAPFFTVQDFQIRLYNVTGASVVKYGSNGYSGNTASSAYTQDWSVINTSVTIAASTTFQLDYRCTISVATNGQGVVSNGVVVSGHKEIYAEVIVVKY